MTLAEPGSSRARGADVVVRTLEQLGVRTIFSLSGNHIMPVYDALVGSAIRLIHVRHEAACVHMADAYSRLGGALGVALVTGGQGHANACAALHAAQANEAPVLLLSGHAGTGELGLGAFQELDQAAVAAPMSKAAWTAQRADDLGPMLLRAAGLARSGRPGPVQVSLPVDLLEARLDAPDDATPADALDEAACADALDEAARADALDEAARADALDKAAWADRSAPADAGLARPMALSPDEAAAVRAAIASARRPLVLGGPGQGSAAVRSALGRLGRHLQVPVLVMQSPRGIADPSLGAFAEALAEADLIVLLGKPLDFTVKFGRPPFVSADARFVVVDADEVSVDRLRRQPAGRLALSARARPVDAIDELLEGDAAEPGDERARWIERVDLAVAHRPPEWRAARQGVAGRVHPLDLCAALQRFFDAHLRGLLVCDGGEIAQWPQAAVDAPERLINGVAGSIGPSLPFALAACALRQQWGGKAAAAPVVAVMGDGTAGFHIAEFDTAVRNHLPVIVVVGNDARWNARVPDPVARVRRRASGALRAAADALRAGRCRVRRPRRVRRRGDSARRGVRSRVAERQAGVHQRDDRIDPGSGRASAGRGRMKIV